MKFVQYILFIGLGTTILLAEPSVYGNGNSEAFYSPRKAITQNKKTITSLKRKVAQQKERIDGLSSVIEGLSATVNDLQQRLATSKAVVGSSADNTELLKELGAMIDKINADYVSKEELQKALKSKNIYVPSGNTKVKEAKPKDSLVGKNTKTLYSEGVRHFMKKRYDEAKKRFMITDIKGYKPAASNYYLGEIAYYTKKYEDAIFYFKKSAGLHDQASYIDTLLLHTAISLEKNGEKAQAKTFYENIIANYAGKKSANIAKQKLKKL